LLLTGLGHGVRGEWERSNRYMNFGPNQVVRVPQSTTGLGLKLVQVLAIATHITRSGFEVRAKWVRVFWVSIFKLGFYARTKPLQEKSDYLVFPDSARCVVYEAIVFHSSHLGF
jgi:hypothetical protein